MATPKATKLVGTAILLLLFVLLSSRGSGRNNPGVVEGQLVESERLLEYHRKNYTWPPNDITPDTPGWRAMMSDRFAQVAAIKDSGQRYEGYYQVTSSSIMAPNFTEHGFGLARCPDELIATLRQGIRDGLPNARTEKRDDVINAPEPPWIIHRRDLVNRAVKELQPHAEAWAGFDLTPWGGYGFRLYRNDSQLTMHVDRSQTHIISFILHIDSSDDAEPWPIFIESFDGSTHEVILTPGDILFYESSKCFHGRPRRLNGSWYSSLFVHYFPKDNWQNVNHELETHHRIPPNWSAVEEPAPNAEDLVMVATSLKEPSCADDWCRAANSIKWSGPGEDGYVLHPNMEKTPFNPIYDRTDEL